MTRNVKILIITVASVALIGFALNAFAHGGMGWGGWGHHGQSRSGDWGHHGQGWHHRGSNGWGYGDRLTEEQYRQLERKREAFFEKTRDLRADLYAKQRELQNELSQNEPDVAAASELQREISELQARLDQKRIEHMIETGKLAPGAGRGFMPDGPMMGFGPRGGGYCRQ